jgi:nicotinamide mononucleotide transporter PnuC
MTPKGNQPKIACNYVVIVIDYKAMFKKFITYFNKIEWSLLICGLLCVTIGFVVTPEKNIFSYLSSVAGITCVIINSKGNVWGQVVAITFGVLYGICAYQQHYYGEMLIYFCLMIPIHIFSIVSWLRHKFNGKKHEVEVNNLKPLEYVLVFVGAAVVTVAFYFLLRALNTDNLIISTISLTTSITAAYFMLRRCEFFSICFVFNDIILIVLWSLKLFSEGFSLLPSVLAFVIFLFCDTYCYLSWRTMKKRQKAQSDPTKLTN